jgi:hypothetical protein
MDMDAQDHFPVEFNFKSIDNEISTRIYTKDGVDTEFTLPEREIELNKQMETAQKQITYIKLLGMTNQRSKVNT